jgi:IS5 family transposase
MIGTSSRGREEVGHRRYKKLGGGSFFGRLVYERAVPKGHFLRQLDRVVEWERFSEGLIRLYQGTGEVGRPPYDPAIILKMLLVSYLYDQSERQTEAFVNDSLSAKCFLGLAVDEGGPDHSTLTAFKRRIIDGGGERGLMAMLGEIIRQAREAGVAFGAIQVVDSTHTEADVNTGKDDGRARRGEARRDRGARWGVKGKQRRKDEKGETVEQVKYFHGYKAHTSLNSEAGMITSVVVTAGNQYDGHQFGRLVERDRGQGVGARIYAADRGYDDSENHYLLESLGLHSAIKLNRYRTKKKDKNKQIWIDLLASPGYQAGQKDRYKIERKFGEAKVYHGLRRCRYVGRVRYAIQAYLTAIVLNLKRMVKLLTGTNFRGRAWAGA